jgi:prevent-host-death family protein
MNRATAVEFRREPSTFRDAATRAPVEITEQGQRTHVLMSAEHYDWLVAAAKRTHRTATAADVVIDAVERAQMARQHASLDELMT